MPQITPCHSHGGHRLNYHFTFIVLAITINGYFILGHTLCQLHILLSVSEPCGNLLFYMLFVKTMIPTILQVRYNYLHGNSTISITPSILVDTAIMLNEILPSRIKFHIIVFDHNLNNYTSQIFNILCNQDSMRTDLISIRLFSETCIVNILENHLYIKRDSNSYAVKHQVLNLGCLPFHH